MRTYLFIAGVIMLALSACKGKNSGGDIDLPENFAQLPDTAQVSFMMKNATPDSVARFICASALGKVPQSQIRNLSIATNYAFEKYSDNELGIFSNTYDEYVASLPLSEKMTIYAKAGTDDPQGLGLQLGLEYMQSIREKNLTPEQVEEELKALKIACKNDPEVYKRFLVGFKTVLKVDQNSDVPKEIYERFINYE